ncbi:hypothetical protein DH86_00004293 [Scytalidium sp. 3C]|nr:hypothetical protein DH86_00004293 [Scytalidium sp. 3C]
MVRSRCRCLLRTLPPSILIIRCKSGCCPKGI